MFVLVEKKGNHRNSRPPAGRGWWSESRWEPRHSRVHSPLWQRRCRFYFHNHPEVKRPELKTYCCEKYVFLKRGFWLILWRKCVGGRQSLSKETWEVDFVLSHLYKCILTVSIKAVPFGVKRLVVSISVNLTLLRTRLVFAVPLTLITDTVR